ncbi:NnrS family protein [Aliiroseovarius sp. F20344]|uniref:NnrS family protein n=1 Tax=Aliiroseovarius sp. F20344 TaxID=2926414 RepID=UPI001FF60351|nr:NnrS family protein [Aliiroseovarius sp. F20344]MCK0143926.1 NnrS family protein [Aliiroseovarius sp. F20344]
MTQYLERILSEGFRAFFLGAAIWAILSGLIWEFWLGAQTVGNGIEMSNLAMSPYEWHAHEMIFGYAGAAVGGFFLTAVASGRGWVIACCFCLWSAGRLVMWQSSALPSEIVAGIDLSFLLVLIARIGAQLVRRPKPQHAVFLVFLTALVAGNLIVHLDWTGLTSDAADEGIRLGLLALIGLIIVLGGHVTPGFIRNAMKRAEQAEQTWPPVTPRLNRASVALAIVLPWSLLVPILHPIIALALALIHALRLTHWRVTLVLRDPLLWSLIAAQSLVVVGLAMWALARWGIGEEVGALHILGLGGIGGMTLAVMSRAILGHTGRALVSPAPVAWGYGLMILSAALRWLAVDLIGIWRDALLLASGAAWIGAFVLFVAGFLPALIGPRPARDVRPIPTQTRHMKLQRLDVG